MFMNATQLFEEIKKKESFLCVGLDTDIRKIPAAISSAEFPQFEFNKAIIDATVRYAVCYKPNLAFYEENGVEGWKSFEKTCRYIRENYPDILIIADAKRGDIGNTSEMYARAFFDDNLVDAVTLSPYMGRDTVEPFYKYTGKWAVILALTSNGSSMDFEMQTLANGRRLYEEVLATSQQWGDTNNTMYVVGATKAYVLDGIRQIVPDHFLLVPGVGAQGGSLHDVAAYGMNSSCGLLVNSSRGIIYASTGEDFAEAAGAEAQKMQKEMKQLLAQYLK